MFRSGGFAVQARVYQTAQRFSGGLTISAPARQENARWNVERVKRGILAGGSALGLLPAHAVERELRDGTLTAVEVRPALPRLVLRALIAPEAVDSPLVEDLVRSLRGLALGA